MNPFLMFLLAILSPFIMAATLLVPTYAGITGAAYVIYNKSGTVNPLHDKLFDVFYMIDVYTRLFTEWSHHVMEADLLTYTLPLVVPPIAGILLSIWLIGKVARKLKDIFHGGMSY